VIERASAGRTAAAVVIAALGIWSVAGVRAGGPAAQAASAQAPGVLRLATTTSTADTGLLDAILPAFQKLANCRVDVVAVGTGQAIEIGRRGDADVLLVHARQAEDQFVADRHARERFDVMFNDFVVLGPAADPAKIAPLRRASEAFAAIAKAEASFDSRADKSGTHTAELAIWAAAKIGPAGQKWYRALGQGMGETLVTANEQDAYTLSDRGTYLSMRGRLPRLRLLVGGQNLAQNPDSSLRNRYGVMAVNPDLHPGVNFALATRFVDWLLSAETQKVIGSYGVSRFGQPLFYPDSLEYKATHELTVIVGGARQTFSLAELQAMPRATLANYQAIGSSVGPLGRFTWVGVSLRDLLLRVDPNAGNPRNADGHVLFTSSDGWTATVLWREVCGTVARGEGLYHSKGCNECHGMRAEGSAPPGRLATPALTGCVWDVDKTLGLLRSGRPVHGNMNGYTPEQLSRADLAAILDWHGNPGTRAKQEAFQPPPDRRVMVLAYERDGKPMTGREGLIQLLVGGDDFASRYAHWVKSIELIPAGR
jgi:tungstate transport system substrate-binding protein